MPEIQKRSRVRLYDAALRGNGRLLNTDPERLAALVTAWRELGYADRKVWK